MTKKALALSRVYRLVEPGPVVLVTTASKSQVNIMTMSWHTMMDFEPPLIGCVMSAGNHSFGLLKKSGACVINIPTVELATKVVGCGNTSGRSIDKFETFGLTATPASCIDVPLIDECYANLECKVVDRGWVAKYNFFVLEVQKAWIDRSRVRSKTIHHLGAGAFMVAGRTIKLPSRMK